jgi:LytS/YehU family sensor histidine kinase
MRWIDLSSGIDPWFAAGNEIIQLVFYALLVYVNLYYLIPRYLARHVLVYLMLAVAFCALITPIEVLALYLKFSNRPEYRTSLIQQQFWIFWGNLLVTFLATVLRVIMDWWRYQNEKQVLLTQTIQSELRFLKSQINPHFLFNTLNNLYALTLKKSDKAPEIVLKLSEIMRYMLYECNEKRVLLSREIQYINNYLDLERLRQPVGAAITFEVEGIVSDQTVAPLLFVPFLENSFKHGLNHTVNGGGFVKLRLLAGPDELLFTIENSKADIYPGGQSSRSGGIGLANVRQRLEMLYPGQHELSIENAPDRYIVSLRLGLNS